MTRMQEFIQEQMISVDSRLPAEDQEVIAWNGKKLVAAIFSHKSVVTFVDETTFAPVKVEIKPTFSVQKYTMPGDRSYSSTWSDITHWMPAQ